MVSQDSLLVILVQLVDRLPMPTPPQKRGRGHPQVYTDRLFLKALVIMMVRHLHNVHELRSRLAQPTAEMQRLRELVSEHGRFPARRTWERPKTIAGRRHTPAVQPPRAQVRLAHRRFRRRRRTR